MQTTGEILKSVRKIEITTHLLVEGLLQGAYHSIFRGRGIEFSEVRPYSHGDDIRTIDWNVTARMNEPYVKEFIEERDLTIYILFDVSASSEFGYEKEKKETAIEIAASLMFAALKNNDNIGLCLFADGIEKYIPPRKGRKHVLRLVREMAYFEPKTRATNLSGAISRMSKIAKKQSIFFILSDFMAEDFEKPLNLLRNRHDVIAINLRDIREEDIPDVGYLELEDNETGEQVLVNTSDPEFRERYARLVKEQNTRLRNTLKRAKVDMVQVESGQSFEAPLRKFFRMRQLRVR